MKKAQKRKHTGLIIFGAIVCVLVVSFFVIGGTKGIVEIFFPILMGKTSDSELQTMIQESSDKFSKEEYTDSETGLTVSYNLYLPDDYVESNSYPMIVFIGDMTTTMANARYSLTQGWGGIVWASEKVQSNESVIVVTIVFPETILDDHDGYQTTGYVDLTPRLIKAIAAKYSVDENRVYGTGQSMGAMTTLLLAAQNPDLYAAILVVDGQWDINELKGIENQKMIFFAAGGDENACNGQDEIMAMLDSNEISYTFISELNAQAEQQELENTVSSALNEENIHIFIRWKTGSVIEETKALNKSEHMNAFDYGYKLKCVRNWILKQ